MTAQTLTKPGGALIVQGKADGDHLVGGPKSDYFLGHHGPDIFEFKKGDGSDYVVSCEDGVDKLMIHGSIKQTSMHDTPQGIEVFYGHFGQDGPDHFVVNGVHHLDLNDFNFS